MEGGKIQLPSLKICRRRLLIVSYLQPSLQIICTKNNTGEYNIDGEAISPEQVGVMPGENWGIDGKWTCAV